MESSQAFHEKKKLDCHHNKVLCLFEFFLFSNSFVNLKINMSIKINSFMVAIHFGLNIVLYVIFLAKRAI